MVSSSQIGLSTTAALLFTAQGRTRVQLSAAKFSAPAVVYFRGTSGVSTANGFAWYGDPESAEVLDIELFAQDEIYGILASGTQTITILAVS